MPVVLRLLRSNAGLQDDPSRFIVSNKFIDYRACESEGVSRTTSTGKV